MPDGFGWVRWRSWYHGPRAGDLMALTRALSLLIVAAFFCHFESTPASAQSAKVQEELRRADTRAMELFRRGKAAEAIQFAEKALELTDKHFAADASKTSISLTTLASLYLSAKRFPEAERTLRRLVELLPKFAPPNSEEFAYALRDLAEAIAGQGRDAEAATAYDRALPALEAALGPTAPDLGTSLVARSALAQKLGEFALAFRLYERGIPILAADSTLSSQTLAESYVALGRLALRNGRLDSAENAYRTAVSVVRARIGKDAPLAAEMLMGLVQVLYQRADYAAAATAAEEAIVIIEAKSGSKSAELVLPLTGLGNFYLKLNRPREAEQSLLRALAIIEAAPGPEQHIKVSALGNLALVYQAAERLGEAESTFKRALDVAERLHGVDSYDILVPLNNLAGFYQTQFRYADALPILKRALAIAESAATPTAEVLATILTNIRAIYVQDGDQKEAEPYARRAYEILRARFGDDDVRTAKELGLLGGTIAKLGRLDEGEDMQRRALAVLERRLPSGNSALIYPYRGMGDLAKRRGRFDEAEIYYRKSMEVSASSEGPQGKGVEGGYEALALLAESQERWVEAFEAMNKVEAMREKRHPRSSEPAQAAATSNDIMAALRPRGLYHHIVEVGFKAAAAAPARAAEIRDTAFRAAQRGVPSQAGRALAQMAERMKIADPKVAALTRHQQELSAEWHALDLKQVAARKLAADKRDRAQEATIVRRQAVIDRELQDLATRIAALSPAAILDSESTLGIADVQAHLAAEEVLVFVFSTLAGVGGADADFPGATYIWAITRSDVRWIKNDLSMLDVARRVAGLRCGVDHTAWVYTVGSREVCKLELGNIYDYADYAAGKLPPFDPTRAYAFYREIFGGIEDMISGRHIIAVPTFTLNRFPLHALVTSPSEGSGPEALRTAAWLARSNAVTVLPAVSALGALRRGAKPSVATRAYLGVANPELDGPDARYASLARAARDRQHCRDLPTSSQYSANLNERRAAPRDVAGARKQAPGKATNGATQAVVAPSWDLRTTFSPLPETAEEACSVAAALKADLADVLLARSATKPKLLAASRDGSLAQYRVLHFATHAFLGARSGNGLEPGLVLTPPQKASAEDDGYLTASEVATLRLDADWVILSACNTARSDTTFLESFTGLTQSFFYAGARSLLVANWEVDSQAAVKLVTHAVATLAAESNLSKAEALRRAMLAVIDSGAASSAHPAIWAPFVVVGDSTVPPAN